jgi:CTP synthase (UTP-ammonia lyase)
LYNSDEYKKLIYGTILSKIAIQLSFSRGAYINLTTVKYILEVPFILDEQLIRHMIESDFTYNLTMSDPYTIKDDKGDKKVSNWDSSDSENENQLQIARIESGFDENSDLLSAFTDINLAYQ